MVETYTVRVEYNGGDDVAELTYDAEGRSEEDVMDMAEQEVETAYGPAPDIKTVEII